MSLLCASAAQDITYVADLDFGYACEDACF